MWMLYLYSVSSFTLVCIKFSEAASYTVLSMKKETGYNVFDLWNLKYTKCGSNGNTNLYRHDYIDHMDPACVSRMTVIFEDKSMFHLRYDNPSSNVIEQIMSRKPDFAQHRTPSSTDHFLTKTSNRYEFLWVNQANNTIYGGIYHSTDISKAPQYVHNVQSTSPYTVNGDPKDFNNINAANDIQIEFELNSGCSLTSTASSQGNCPGKSKPTIQTTQTIVDVYQGSHFTLQCSYTAYGLATTVDWTFTDSSGITSTITENTNPTKYSGSSVTNPSLTIYNFAATDEGTYKCAAVNSKGRGEGTNIHVTMILASTTEQDMSTANNDVTTEVSTSTTTASTTEQKISTANNDVTTEVSTLTTTEPTTVQDFTDNTSDATTTKISSTADMGITADITTPIVTNSNNMNSSPTTVIQNNDVSTHTTGQSQTTTAIPSSAITTSSTSTGSCFCNCTYTGDLLSWLPANWTSLSTEELRIVLQPRLKELEQNLTVDKKSLSAYRNTLISAPDERVSSKSLGVLGISFLTCVLVFLCALDCINLITAFKNICSKS